MTVLVALLLLVGTVWGYCRVRFASDRRPVTRGWLRDCDRRTWTDGVEGISVHWPINKLINEHADFQTRRTRRRG